MFVHDLKKIADKLGKSDNINDIGLAGMLCLILDAYQFGQTPELFKEIMPIAERLHKANRKKASSFKRRK